MIPISQVGSLNTDGSFEVRCYILVSEVADANKHVLQYYISQPTDLNDLKGVAAFVLASLEYEMIVLK